LVEHFALPRIFYVEKETHNDPAQALCDGAQSLDLPQFEALMEELKKRAVIEEKEI
jgi:3-deoxy-7-phosphoheptulonate synthase